MGNLSKRGPLKLTKKKTGVSPRLASQLWEEAVSESPYLSPSPVWRVRVPVSGRSRMLPPLVEPSPILTDADAGWPNASGNFGDSPDKQQDGSNLQSQDINSSLVDAESHGQPRGSHRGRFLEAGRRRSSVEGGERWDSRRESAISDDDGLDWSRNLPDDLKEQLSGLTGSLSTSIVLHRRKSSKS